jgi:HEAT repeat protein
MFEFTCGACQTTARTTAVHSDRVTLCPNCHQHLHLVLADEEAEGESPGPPPLPPAPRPSGCASLMLIGGSGFCGTAGAVAIILLWVFLGRGKAPTTPDTRPEPVAEGRGAPVRSGQVSSVRADTYRERPSEVQTKRDFVKPAPLTGVARLLRDLSDGTPEERARAASQLGQMRNDARQAAPALVKALQDGDPRVRRDAAAALGQLGPAVLESDNARAPLMARLRDENGEVRQAALTALPRLGRPSDAAALRDMLANRATPPEPRLYAARALVDFGGDTLPTLIDALTLDSDPGVAAECAGALGTLKRRTREVGSALTRALDHADKGVRVAAAKALGALGTDAATLAGVLKALAAPEAEVRDAVLPGRPSVSVLGKDAPQPELTKDALSQLKPALSGPQPRGRQYAAFALASLGAEAAGAAPDLRAALAREKKPAPGQAQDVRLELLAAFVEIGPAALTALEPNDNTFLDDLADIAKDTDAPDTHRTCAALALAKLAPDRPQTKGVLKPLAEALLLKDHLKPDPVEKALHDRARKALPKVGKPAVAAITQVARASFVGKATDGAAVLRDKEHARRATFEVLAEFGPVARAERGSKDDVVAQMIAVTVDPRNREPRDVVEAANKAAVAIYGPK